MTFQLVSGIRRLKYARLIRRSLLLDPGFYLGQCGQDRSARRDPFTHYLTTGAAAGLNPNPFFDTRFYLERNPDVAAAGKNPLVHYIRHGWREGRAPSALFDGAYYVERYPDVMDSAWPSPLAHYLRQGWAEGRDPVRADEGLVPDLLEWSRERDPSRADRVLVIDHAMLTPDQDSASVRLLAIIRMLREGGLTVTFGAAGRTAEFEDGKRRLAALGVESLCGPDAITSHLIACGHLYGTALLSRPEVARRYMPLVRGHAPWARVVYDTVDLHWIRLERAAELNGGEQARDAARQYRNLELLNTAAADLTLAITANEREVLSRAVPGTRIEVLPNVHECSPSTVPWEGRRGIMFIGGYQHLPNVDAVEWFVAEIFPLVRKAVPGMVFHIVGSKAPERIRSLSGEGLDVVGYVPDAGPLFRASRVFVSPLRYGAGMKGKIGQSMGYGLPVVTTTIGAEGMGLVHGTTALVADDPAAFADAVVRLHSDRDLWERISRAAASHVQSRFSVDALREHVRRLLQPGTGARPARAPRISA